MCKKRSDYIKMRIHSDSIEHAIYMKVPWKSKTLVYNTRYQSNKFKKMYLSDSRKFQDIPEEFQNLALRAFRRGLKHVS